MFVKKFIIGLSIMMSTCLYSMTAVYKEKPPHFPADQDIMEIVACFIKVGDDHLFLHRIDTCSEPNRWGIPGGKVDREEAIKDAVMREVYEETGHSLADAKYLKTVYIETGAPNKKFIYHMFETELEKKFDVQLSPTEHKDFAWMTLKDSFSYPLIQGEKECIELAYFPEDFEFHRILNSILDMPDL